MEGRKRKERKEENPHLFHSELEPVQQKLSRQKETLYSTAKMVK